jgi:pimeloyl-ACP methyl ester carboxylesterase
MGESGFLEVDGGRIYYEVEGEGHPLLIIHGGLGSLRMWDGQAPAFAERYRVIRYDTRGFGRTETDDEAEFTNRGDAVAVLDHVGATSAFVVGQSRGGVIGLDLTIDQPDRVDALVSVAGGVGGYEPQLPDGVEAPPWDEMERLWEAKDWEALAELETRVWVDGWGRPADRVDPEIRKRVKGWILANYEAQIPEGKPQPLDPSAANRLGEVRAPLLVVIGLDDEPGCVVAERHLAESVEGAEVVELPGVAHMIQLEEPERFSRLVLDFLGARQPPRARA